MRVTVSATGGEHADVLLSVFPFPGDGYRIHIYAWIGHPQFLSRSRVERAKFAVERGAYEDQAAGGYHRSTVGCGCSCLGHAELVQLFK